ncbi:MAG: polysaccharide deacetylase family protein [Treponema sp.]|jgi:peptidoglycan/xylan/chitin deacetylase (PgdA/CDA1 family)|nr:polysaccharide deacetylase family protein [Treponema sp.]
MAFKKYFTLSFDDGIEHDKQLIAIMKQYGLSGTFNLNAGLFGYKPRFFNISRIPKDEILQVYDGFEIASHGYRHEYYRLLTREKIEESISTDIKELSELTGKPVAGHAYPYDAYTGKAEDCLKKNSILYARRATGKGSFRFHDNPYRYIPTCWFNAKNVFQLIDQFVNAEPQNENMLFMMWGHSYEMEYGLRKCPKEQLERIFSKIAGHSDIVYCTNKEAFEQNKIPKI